jgi:hypothetical protein
LPQVFGSANNPAEVVNVFASGHDRAGIIHRQQGIYVEQATMSWSAGKPSVPADTPTTIPDR